MPSLTYAFGRNPRSTISGINPDECTDGENFDLELGVTEFKGRDAFGLKGTATNGGEIRGYAQLEKADGTLTTLIQAGDTMYLWDGTTGFTSVGSVDATSEMRGPLTANFTLLDKVIITDLQKATVVQEWDGATFGVLTENLAGTFFAKYCFVDNERALYANITETSTLLPHLFLGSAVGDPGDLTRTTTPTGADDPFFLTTPDLKPLNGLTAAFGQIILPTSGGSIFKLIGSVATDFSIDSLYVGSAPTGDEALVNIGNDVVIGRGAVIDLLSDTDRFGDVATDDVSNPISNDLTSVTEWRLTYDQVKQRVYCLPTDLSEVHVLYKNFLPAFKSAGVSPWSKYTTTHGIAFQPSIMFSIKNPEDGVITTYMGDENGNIFKMDEGKTTDPGSNVIIAFRESILFSGDEVFDVTGWVDYIRTAEDYDIITTIQWMGDTAFDSKQTITAPALEIGAVYAGQFFYGGGPSATSPGYYGAAFSDRFFRRDFKPEGQSGAFQIRTEVAANTGFSVANTTFEAQESKSLS